ncbi:TPA: alpha/beta fold hydrolase [Acinetobacter baumannii]
MAVMCTDNIIATLESHAKLNGNKIAFEYLGRQSGGIQSLTYADLNERVQHQAQILMSIVDSGDRAVLLFEPGLDFIVSFFACLKAKIIAVPVSLPFNRNGFSNILNIMNDCEPKIVLTTKKILELAGLITLKAQNENLILHAVDAELQRDLVEKDFPLITEKDICFLQYTSGSYEASKILGHQAFIEACKRLNVPWTAINPATVIDGFYNYGDMQYIGIADMIGKLYQGRLLALPGGRDTFLPLCNMQYIVSFLIRTMSYPETIAQEYMLLDPATPKFHRLVHLAAEHLGVSSPHLQIPKVLLEKLPEVLLDGSKEQLSFISTEHYHVAGAEAMAAKMGIADLISIMPYFSRWIDRLVFTRFGRMQVPTPNSFSYQNRYWTEIYTNQPVGSEKVSALFLHGIPFDSACWSPIINKITYDQVAMMDLPGLGRSGSYEMMEDNNHQFIDTAAELLAPNSVVIAHSLGCLFALNLAKKYPDKVARLILISPYFVQAQAAKMFQIQAISKLIFRFVPKDVIAKDLHPEGQQNLSVRYAMDSLRRMSVSKHISEYMHHINLPQQRAAQTALLSELRSKIEIIVGEKDPIVTPISPDIPVHIIAGAGHNPHVTHVEAVYDHLTPVLTKYISTTAQLSDV